MNKGAKIMLVEDDPDICKLAKFALQRLGGFEVLVCPSGEQALDNYSAFAPDLILLDVMMPGLDGPATLSRLRSEHAEGLAPVIFMTAKALPGELMELERLDVAGIILKPFDPLSLPGKVREIAAGLEKSK